MSRFNKWSDEDEAKLLQGVKDKIPMEDIAKEIADLLKGVPKAISETFGVKSPIEFPVDYSMGLTLLDVKHSV